MAISGDREEVVEKLVGSIVKNKNQEAPSLLVIEEEEIDNEFYEKIKAPKFVDFIAPEIRRSHEDHCWFYLRVGCDRNHEEELDSEAICKNFVLQVMAARSPNVCLRKAICQREASANLKCPHTAHAKSSESRVSRLNAKVKQPSAATSKALISSELFK